MSDPRAIAARMTGFRPVDHRDVVGGGTPGLGLTGVDVAAALSMGGADEVAEAMVRLKYVNDFSVQNGLFYHFYDRAIALAGRERWKVPKGEELIRRMCKLALHEAVSPGICPACHGRGHIYQENAAPRSCGVCNGVGRRVLNKQQRAAALEMSPQNFGQNWERRYLRILLMVESEEQAGLRALAKGIGPG